MRLMHLSRLLCCFALLLMSGLKLAAQETTGGSRERFGIRPELSFQEQP